MIYNNLEFFNVSEIVSVECYPGLRINRFPKNLINSFDNSISASYSRGCEIRFIIEDGQVTIFLMAVDEDGQVAVFFGDYIFSHYILPKGVVTPVHITKLDLLNRDFDELNIQTRFSKRVCRVFFNNKAIIHYCGIETYGNRIEPPHDSDKPKLSWLAYGSSITHGASAISNYNSYIQQVARLLNSQVHNFGMSGACMCEKEMADFIAEQNDLDFLILELGVNMRNGYTPHEFKKRAKYLLEKTSKSQKKIFLITIYPNIHTYYNESPISENEVVINNILRDIINNNSFGNVYLIEGSEILKSFNTLTHDLIHPSDSGHTEMAYNLYCKILPIIN